MAIPAITITGIMGDRYYGPRDVVHHWGRYHLPPPPYGYVWIRSNGQFLMLAEMA